MHINDVIRPLLTIELEFVQLKRFWTAEMYYEARMRAIVLRAHIAAGGRWPSFRGVSNEEMGRVIANIIQHTDYLRTPEGGLS